jgi:phosphoserine phosphatase
MLDAMNSLLVVTDVDSTLIGQEVIELLAAEAGSHDRVAEITDRAMHGDIDFNESLRERVATLAGLPVAAIDRVAAQVSLNPGAAELIAAVHTAGGRIGAVSGGFIQVLRRVAFFPDLDACRANVLGVRDGRLTGEVDGPIVSPEAKAQALRDWAGLWEVPREHVVACGDGANDLIMMRHAGFAVGFRPKPVVADACDLVVNDFRQAFGALGLPALGLQDPATSAS